jgi:NitT/TauT family transport system ATP-binding protein
MAATNLLASASITRTARVEIDILDVHKVYRTGTGTLTALQGVTLEIGRGEFVSVIGKSGCGKSTLLQIIGGLIDPSRGQVLIRGDPIRKASRKVGFVFQRSVLLEWRTVLENILLPIEIFKLRSDSYLAKAHELLRMMGLEGFAESYPDELSGGMQQRAAIVRSLLYDPEIMLMDEPFGSLDAMTREQMHLELLRIWQTTGKTIFFVTHDISEAIFLSDRVVLLGARPGNVRDVVKIDLPRPRVIETTYLPAFSEYRRYLRDKLG